MKDLRQLCAYFPHRHFPLGKQVNVCNSFNTLSVARSNDKECLCVYRCGFRLLLTQELWLHFALQCNVKAVVWLYTVITTQEAMV